VLSCGTVQPVSVLCKLSCGLQGYLTRTIEDLEGVMVFQIRSVGEGKKSPSNVEEGCKENRIRCVE
jgi:hypothetical protein